MYRRQYNWKKEEQLKETNEETLELLIREDNENQFRALVKIETSKAFEVILNRQNVIQFIVILKNQIDTETLKSLVNEFIANNFAHDNIIQSLRRPTAFSHSKNVNSHLESFYDDLVIKKYSS